MAIAPDLLKTVGLGSCVGVVLFDQGMQLAGMIHVMLPKNTGKGNASKYADTGIRILLEELRRRGAKRIVAKIAGGAQMFATLRTMQMGLKNVEEVKQVLLEESVPLIAQDVGGNSGRTIVFHIDSAQLHITGRDMSLII